MRGQRGTEAQTIQVDGLGVQLIRKRVKNVNLRVRRDGTVAVSAPFHVPEREVAAFVRAKRAWVERARKRLAQEPADPFESATEADRAEWKAIVQAFAPPLIQKWERILGVRAGKLAFRNMKSRWGSCQPGTGRICLNTRLALYPPACLEYVVVHELCHLIMHGHSPAFYGLLDEALPGWREARSRLSSPPEGMGAFFMEE